MMNMMWKSAMVLLALPVIATHQQLIESEPVAGRGAIPEPSVQLAANSSPTAFLAAGSWRDAAPRIIIRHDVPDERYRALGEQYRRTFVDLSLPGGDGTPQHGDGGGSLIDPRWVVTAAHVAAHIWKDDPRSPMTGRPSVHVDGTAYPIERVFLHPDYVAGGGQRFTFDIALVKLAVPVEGGEPACLYPGHDEPGKIATLVGTGRFGTGLTGPVGSLGTLRGATVTINPLRDERVLEWNFRGADDPQATELEGIAGPGDSGGPAFLVHEGRLCVAGVSSSQFGEGFAEGRYGVLEVYPRISHYRPWIEAVMRGEHGSGIEVRGTGVESAEISPDRIAAYVGSYGGDRRVFERSGSLYWQAGDNPEWLMLPIGPDEFALGFAIAPSRVKFESMDGRVMKAQLIRFAQPPIDIDRVR